MLNSKEIKTITNKFIGEYIKINPEINQEEYRSIVEGVVSNAGGNKHEVIRNLTLHLANVKREQRIKLLKQGQ